ncbi:hypothetical protein AKO1_008197 [Acrasis kona]|uniref:Uncharacterized protein n=1 Tax=Acrasis kona TaxID=1008807 RepID=A0AAW2YMK1_9EUKA
MKTEMKRQAWIDIELPDVKQPLLADSQMDWPSLFGEYERNKKLLEEFGYLRPSTIAEYINYKVSKGNWRRCDPLPEIHELMAMRIKGDFRNIWEAHSYAINLLHEFNSLPLLETKPLRLMTINSTDLRDGASNE